MKGTIPPSTGNDGGIRLWKWSETWQNRGLECVQFKTQ